MKIISLVENRTKSNCKAKHGLSLYIETKTHKILFDLGSDDTLFDNAVRRNIDLSKVDTVIKGAKEMLLVDEVDNKEFLAGLFKTMYDELPNPKPKKKK